jgi:lipopolysaccharide biosynthesis regulator YciM
VRAVRELFRILALAVVMLGAAAPGACLPEESKTRDDLMLADAALAEHDQGDAEMYLLRYLRKNPEGDRRWEVWRRLLRLTLNVRQDKATAREYLEIMLREFAGDPERKRGIAVELAELCRDMGFNARAADLWEGLAGDPDLNAEDRATVYKELAYAYMRRLEFTPAAEVLALCLDLKVVPDLRADCRTALSETQMLNEDMQGAEQSLRALLAMEGIAEQRRTAAVFMLADVVEQQQRPEEARSLLESILHDYPNSKVIEIRLAALKGKKSASGRSAGNRQ